MKHLPFLFLFVLLGSVAFGASERANTVLLHPGEVIYARFTQKGTKLKLVSASKEKDDAAQVILSLDAVDPVKKTMLNLKMENKFTLDLVYRMEIRYRKESFLMPATNSRVVREKMSLEQVPALIDGVAIYAFQLEK